MMNDTKMSTNRYIDFEVIRKDTREKKEEPSDL